MGLINHDVFESSNGVQKADSYMSFNNETLYLRKANGAYSVHANYRIFWDKAARDAGKSFLELRNISAKVSEADLANNLYGVLYAELKKQYPNAVDEQEQVAVPSESVVPASESAVPASEPVASEPVAPSEPASESAVPASEPVASESAVPASEPVASEPASEPVASESAVPASEPVAPSEPAPAPSQ
jgi:hypothetical protein